MAKKWIQKAIKRPGALTKKAKADGKSVAAFIPNYESKNARTKGQIAFARTLRKLSEERKKIIKKSEIWRTKCYNKRIVC